MKYFKFILSIAVSMAVSSAVTHYVDTHSKATNAKDVKDIKACTINITTENASFHNCSYVDVVATSDYAGEISLDNYKD